MITDLMVAMLPVPAIWRLQLVRRQKIALVCLLCVGWMYGSYSLYINSNTQHLLSY